jgi:hypothetical protein
LVENKTGPDIEATLSLFSAEDDGSTSSRIGFLFFLVDLLILTFSFLFSAPGFSTGRQSISTFFFSDY